MPGLVGQCRAVAEPTADASLVRAARDGDRAAFNELYARYGRVVHGILLARTPRREVADLVQDVFWPPAAVVSLREPGRRRLGGRDCAPARRGLHRQQRPDDRWTMPAEPAAADRPRQFVSALRAAGGVPRTLVLRLVGGPHVPRSPRDRMTHGSVRVNLHRGLEAAARARLGR
jgi:RNA polymerase sigma-70 factor (ECF subfamily)